MMKILSSKITIGIGIGLIVIVGGYFVFFHHPPKYQFVTVERGSITESVSLTGNTTPTESVSLGFSNTGTISNIYSSLGKHVGRGAVLATLNLGNLSAQLRQAQAAVDGETAKLNSLKIGG